jgi:hypothetical protein
VKKALPEGEFIGKIVPRSAGVFKEDGTSVSVTWINQKDLSTDVTDEHRFFFSSVVRFLAHGTRS